MKWAGTAILAAALAGCTQHWDKPGAGPFEFESTLSGCEARAFAQFPPVMDHVQTSAGYTTPSTMNCSGFGYDITCNGTGGQYVPPRYITLDVNQNLRRRGVDACLLENGWRRAEKRSAPVETPRRPFAAPPPGPQSQPADVQCSGNTFWNGYGCTSR